MPGRFNTGVSITGPAIGAFAITPNDTTDLSEEIRAITLNVGGTLSFIDSVDGSTHTTGELPAGTYVLLASRIRATGTTATGITGWV